MRSSKPFTCRRVRSAKRSAIATLIALTLQSVGGPAFVPAVHAQQQVAPVGQGFVIDAGDLRFIYQQILVAQDHAAGGQLLGPGPNQVHDPQLPVGLRTVDGSFNNLVPIPDQHMFGAADRLFPRLTTPLFQDATQGTSYKQTTGDVIDPEPRIISNIIVDQSRANPAAAAAADHACGSGGFVCSDATPDDPFTGNVFIPNITPDFGLSAPYNLMFTFFGQFFDHGLDLVPKSGGAVIMPLQPDDPLFVPGGQTNFMVMTRGEMQPGPDGILGTADDVHDSINQTTPWVDQNQTYTSHPAHQVFLRQYQMVGGKPAQTGKVLDGGFCAPRPTGIAGDDICDIGNWAEVKAQAATLLGIHLVDQDVFNVPLILTDAYGHFKPGPNGFPQMVRPGNILVEGNPAANGGTGVPIPADAFRTGHAFLNDIAHNAAPNPGLVPDADNDISVFGVTVQPVGTYDDELLNRHFVTGDGRGNENIALTMVHQIFHAEHNRLRNYIDDLIPKVLTPEEVQAWHAVHPGSGWDYNERLFQAARFATEMQYQHLVFEEFARRVQPLINPFLGGLTSIDAAISAEFAHTVYRLGHSMLPEIVGRTNADGSSNDIRLLHAFLNPIEYNDGGPCTTGADCIGGRRVLTADKAAGALVRGLARQVGNELDEFVTSSVRNTLVGLPLDLPAVNIARGRSEGIPPLNVARRQFYSVSHDAALKPYANWFEFGLALRHIDSLVNFVAAYGTHPSIVAATTVADKRAAAELLVNNADQFLFDPAATTGLDKVDFWVGGLAEKPSVFGGLLGTTFNFVFETQLEHLQDGDRFYYLQRTDGLNFRFQLEGNSFAELIRRNTDMGVSMDVIFSFADFQFDVASLTDTAPIILDPANPTTSPRLLTLSDGTKFFFDPMHAGKNVTFNGTAGNDKIRADVGDDSLFGNAGDDRITGGEGNDTLLGGAGDDILFGDNGDDVLKGGPGNDAMQSGPGFGGDLMIGGEGNDFMVGGDDGVEYFGAGGNDIIVDGSMRSEGIFGGAGDDWIYDGDGHDGGMFGDDGNVFDLLAGLSSVGGDDVLGGGPGQDNHFGEGGDDIMLMSEGSNKFFGDFGFDWITQRGWPAPGNIELNLLAIPNVALNFNDLRNFYRFVDGASGWDFNDRIVGDENVFDPTGAAPPEINLQPQMALTVEGAARISGLTDLVVNGFGVTPSNAPVQFLDSSSGQPALGGETRHILFIGGNILLGGKGSDTIEGRGGDDLIDGDVWLNVQLKATLNDGTVKFVNDPRDLIDDIFSDPQRLNPGHIEIVRSIVTPTDTPAPDCGSAAPLNCDTAVFSGPQADYSISINPNGTITVVHTAGVGFKAPRNDGTDTLRNIERLQFSDGIVAAPTPVLVPSLVGLTQLAATQALFAAGLSAITIPTNSTTALIGTVISQSPAAGATTAAGAQVTIATSIGTQVPSVVGSTQSAAGTALAAAGLVAGAITNATSASVPAGSAISQAPAAGSNVQPGSAVALTVSSGAPPVTVPNVVGATQSAASATITGAGLTVGSITSVSSASVPSGSVISQSPASGTSVAPGSAVALTVSTGGVAIVGSVTRNQSAPTNTITSPTLSVPANTMLVALISAGGPATGANASVVRVQSSGGLSWTRAVRAAGQPGTAEVWWAFTTKNLAVAAQAQLSGPQPASITLLSVTGTGTSVVGSASAIASGLSGAPTASLTTTRDASIVIGVGVDRDGSRVLTPAAGQTIVSQFNPAAPGTYWVQRTNALPVGTNVTISDSYGASMPDRWNLALIEIRKR